VFSNAKSALAKFICEIERYLTHGMAFRRQVFPVRRIGTD